MVFIFIFHFLFLTVGMVKKKKINVVADLINNVTLRLQQYLIVFLLFHTHTSMVLKGRELTIAQLRVKVCMTAKYKRSFGTEQMLMKAAPKMRLRLNRTLPLFWP